MKKEIETQILIQATPEKVWANLTSFEEYPAWNPFIKSIQGKPKVGAIIKAKIKPSGSKPMTFKPRVLMFDPEKEFRWRGKFLVEGLFDGEHYFKILDHNDGTVTLVHGEKFKGILLFMMNFEKVQASFEAMNIALKNRAEAD